jgi:hypothetical protein
MVFCIFSFLLLSQSSCLDALAIAKCRVLLIDRNQLRMSPPGR